VKPHYSTLPFWQISLCIKGLRAAELTSQAAADRYLLKNVIIVTENRLLLVIRRQAAIIKPLVNVYRISCTSL